MTTDRRRWLAFLEEGVGFVALVAVAVARSGSADRWVTFAWLVGAYVAGMLVATGLLERRLPFGSAPGPIDAPEDIGAGWPAGLELLGAAIAFAALTVAFDRGALPPAIAWLGLAVVVAAAWTIGHGFAGALRIVASARRARTVTPVGHPTNPS